MTERGDMMKMNIKDKDLRYNILNEIEQRLLSNQDAVIYIWGCAKTAETVSKYIYENSSLDICGYIVDDKYYNDGEFCGKKIYAASEWIKRVKQDDVVIFGFTNQDAAKKMIKQLPEYVTYYYFFFPYSLNAYNKMLTFEYYSEHIDDFEGVYYRLEDDFSKKTMEAYINSCISGDIAPLDELRVDGQYFNDITKDFDVSCFVDCGAYIGDTIEQAMDFYNEKISKVIAFEPDSNNINILKERVKTHNISTDNIVLIDKGAWSRKDILFFSSSDSSSNISDDGDIKVEVDSVDNIVGSDIMVDYIKMDIEGSEQEALIGSKETILRCMPLLAICVYHRPEDLIVLSKTIVALIDSKRYKFYLRYHGPDLRELVMYVVPVSRS